MPDEPPWEWVDGDSLQTALFRLLGGVLWGVGALLAFVSTVSILGVAGVISGLVVSSGAVIPVISLVFTVGLLLWGLAPRWFPVTGRIGISPEGLRLALPLFKKTVIWPAVRWVGPDWVEVDRGHGSLHFKLTTHQVQRITGFVRPGGTGREAPLP
jgi:hypothetical protein